MLSNNIINALTNMISNSLIKAMKFLKLIDFLDIEATLVVIREKERRARGKPPVVFFAPFTQLESNFSLTS